MKRFKYGHLGSIITRKCYCQFCGGQGVPCHTTSPHGLIPPPIKRARTLVSCVVVTVISVKIIILIMQYLWLLICECEACGWVRADLAGKFRFPTSSDRQNVAASPLPASHRQLCAAGFSFPAFHFWLFPQTVCALLETTNGFDSYLSLQGESALCKIAHEFKDDLNDDGVRNGC